MTIVMINGKAFTTNSGNISLVNNEIMIDGKKIDDSFLSDCKEINVNINGDVNNIKTTGAVSVDGNVKGAINTNGHVEVHGCVEGNIDTNGHVDVGGNVGGDIDTNGNITCYSNNRM